MDEILKKLEEKTTVLRAQLALGNDVELNQAELIYTLEMIDILRKIMGEKQ